MQVSSRNACWIKTLNFSKDFFEFIEVGLYVLRKSQVVDDGSQFPTDVPIVLNTADKLLSNNPLSLIQLQKVQLGNQLFVQGTWCRKRNLPIFIVRVVVPIPLHFVAPIVVIQIVVYIDLIGLLPILVSKSLIVILLSRRFILFHLAFFQGRVDFKLFFDTGIQLRRRHLQQLDKLNLLRRKFLRE